MPQYQENIAVPNHTTDQLMLLALATYKHLGWTAEYATDNRLTGYSKKKWNSYYDHIIADAEDGNLTILSKLPETASFDIMKRNKKNVSKFIDAFDLMKSAPAQNTTAELEAELTALKEQTGIAITEAEKEAEEVESVMNLSAGSKTITYTIMGINILLFVLMVISGVSIFDPTVADIAKWGGNYKPLTTGGDWWRLFTSTFIHIGIIHIAFNMYAFYMVGVYLEPMLGKWKYIVAYLCTGILASLTSTWWNDNQMISAGASGAIFGLYGVFLALLTTKLIPKTMRKALLQSIGIFIVYNLLYSAKAEGIDNAAHIGGLLSGAVIGYAYYFTFKEGRFRPTIITAIIAAATVVVTFLYLNASKSDTVSYNDKVEQVIALDEKALAPFNKTNVPEEELIREITTVSKIHWQKAKEIMKETEDYKIDPPLAEHRVFLLEYLDLRNKQVDLLEKSLEDGSNVDVELDKINRRIIEIIEKKETE